MTTLTPVTRRNFLRTAIETAMLGGIAISSTLSASDKTVDLRQYEPELGDRLWMWGHGPNSTRGLYNIPEGHGIDMADAIKYMGIPNVCVTRWLGLPAPDENNPDAPFDYYIPQFRDTKRVAWSIVDGAPQPYEQKKKWAFELSQKMPNLTALFLDDFYNSGEPVILANGTRVTPANLTLEQLETLQKEVATLPRKTDISVVLYSNQLSPGIKPHIDLCDVVSFWTWHATDLVKLETNFSEYRKIIPDKRTLLGVYMWDFGNMKPITPELMKIQLDFALRKFKEGEIEGMIFHCTPLCDMGLDAVEYSRQWIAENRDTTR